MGSSGLYPPKWEDSRLLSEVWSNSIQSVNVSGGAAAEAIISGLTSNTTYTIEVAAVNSTGIGKYSLSMTATTSSKGVWYQPVSLDCVHSVAICTLYFIVM